MLIAFLLVGFSVRADTVTLKDGTVLEGQITAEDNRTLSIYLEFSGGTITLTRLVDKADVAEVVRWTPEQRAHWQEKREYENLKKYRLNSTASYRAEYYDQVINGVFRRFLTQHVDSPYTSNVTERIVEWKAERDLVIAGNIKSHGRWSPATEVTPPIERERGEQLLQQGRSLMAQGWFESAVQPLQLVVRMNGQPELVSQAKPLLASAYQQAMTSLNHQRQQLVDDVSSAKQQVEQSRHALELAETSLTQAMDSGKSLSNSSRDLRSAPSYQAIGAGSQSTAQAQIAVNKARSDLNSAQNHLDQVKSQLDVVIQKLATLKSLSLVAATSAPPAPKAQPAPVDSSDPLVEIMTWLKKNWIAIVVVVLAFLALLSRSFKD